MSANTPQDEAKYMFIPVLAMVLPWPGTTEYTRERRGRSLGHAVSFSAWVFPSMGILQTLEFKCFVFMVKHKGEPCCQAWGSALAPPASLSGFPMT